MSTKQKLHKDQVLAIEEEFNNKLEIYNKLCEHIRHKRIISEEEVDSAKLFFIAGSSATLINTGFVPIIGMLRK